MSQSSSDEPPETPDIPPAYADDDAAALRAWVTQQAGAFRVGLGAAAARRGELPPTIKPRDLLPRELMPRQPRGPRGGSLTRAAFLAQSDAAYIAARREFHGREPTQADIAARIPFGLRQWQRLKKEYGYHAPPA